MDALFSKKNKTSTAHEVHGVQNVPYHGFWSSPDMYMGTIQNIIDGHS